MKKLSFVLLLVLVLALGALMCGCAPEQAPDSNAGDEANGDQDASFAITNELLKQAEQDMLEALAPLPEMGNGEKIGAIAFSMTNPFWVTVQDGYEDAAAEYGVTVDVVASKSGIVTEMSVETEEA